MTDFPKYLFIDDSTLVRGQYNNVYRSEMEIGPQKTRPIQTIPLFSAEFQVSMNAKRMYEFRQWFSNDLRSGALWFLMNDPFDGTRRRFRFAETEISWTKSGNLYRSAFVLEAYDEL